MEPAEHLDAIRVESAALVAAAEAAGATRAVPSCPDWTIADLLGHFGTVQRWAAGIVEQRLAEPDWRRDIDRPDDAAALAEWVRSGTQRLVAVLESTPPDAECWTFAGRREVRFWFRRQAHEAALHRVDAELAVGPPRPIEAELARDGIDEFLDVVAASRLRERLTGEGETLHFHRTDGEGEWLVRLTPGGPEVERAHAKGDVAVRAGASDLLLVLRNRIGTDAVEVFGDASLLERWHELARV